MTINQNWAIHCHLEPSKQNFGRKMQLKNGIKEFELIQNKEKLFPYNNCLKHHRIKFNFPS